MTATLAIPSHGDRDPRHAVWFLLALTAVTAIVSGFYEARHWQEPGWWTAAAAEVLNYATFAWYRRDTDACGIRRSRLSNVFVILLAPLAVPLYLLRRADRHRLRALLRMVAFVLLFFVIDTVAALLGALLA